MARRHTNVFLDLLQGKGFAQPNPRPMFPNPPGLLRLEPHSEGLRDRIWWGAATNATAEWAAKLGMNLQSSTLKFDESGKPFHIQQAEQIRMFRAAWKEAGHAREPRVSVSRSIFALVDDRDRAYFGRSDSQITSGTSSRRSSPCSDAAMPPSRTCSSSSSRATRLSPKPIRCSDRAEPARRGIQRARHRGDPDTRRPSAGVAVTANA